MKLSKLCTPIHFPVIGNNLVSILLVTTVISVPILSYYPILDYGFTGTDTLPLILTNRIESLFSIVEISTSKLLPSYLEGDYYRPITNLSYSLDYAVWSLQPFGYHLTNLLLHAFNTTLLYLLIKSMARQHTQLVAWIGAAIFAIHPIQVETVPVVSRRADLLSTFFIILSVVLLHFSNSSRSKIYLSLAVFAMTMAIGAKDSAIILPALIFIYIFTFLVDQSRFLSRVIQSFRIFLPFLITVFAYLSVRISVLDGLGGHALRSNTSISHLREMPQIVINYFEALFYPADYFNLYGRLILFPKDLQITLTALGAVCIVVLMTIIVYYLVKQAFFYPLLSKYRRLKAKQYLFCLSWLNLYLLLYVFSGQFMYWYSYPVVISIATLIALGLNDLTSTIEQHLYLKCYRPPFLVIVVTPLLFSLVTSFIIYSPLLSRYSEWEEISIINEQVLNSTADCIQKQSDLSSIYLINYPRTLRYQDQIPHVRQGAILRDYSVEAWIKLHFRERQNINVKSLSYLGFTAPLSELRSSLELENGEITAINVNQGGEMWLTNNTLSNYHLSLISNKPFSGSQKLTINHHNAEHWTTSKPLLLIYDYNNHGKILDSYQICTGNPN